MADEIKLDIKVTVPSVVTPAGDMPDKWADGLTNNAERINDRRQEKIPDDGTFNALMAGPSSAKYSPMIDSAFISDSGRNQANIIRAQYKNLADAYPDWNAKLGLAFATVDGVIAKRFKDQVNNSKDRWATAVAAKTLRATGDKIRGLFLPQVLFWMTGDYRANQMTNALEIIDGAPYDFTYAGAKQPFKAGLSGMLVHSLMMILNADFLAAEITAQNTKLNLFCNTLKDFAVAPVKGFVPGGGALDSLCDFEYADPELKLHCRVVLV